MTTTFWVTTNCNLNCKYCYEGEDKLNCVMSKDIVDRAIDFTVNYFKNTKKDELTVPIHGGEPFLAFDMMKYIVNEFKEKAKNVGKKVSFITTTNATILNDKILEFIEKEIPDITVSIDGTKETHDKMRPFKGGNGSHDIVIKNSLKLLEKTPNMRLRMTFDSESVANLYKDVKYLIDLGFKCIVPAPNMFDKNWDEVHVEILEQQIMSIKSFIEEKEDVVVSLTDKNNYSLKGPCNGGNSSFHIYPDGDIYPCVLAGGNKEFCIGNIFYGIDNTKKDSLLSYSSKINPDCDGCKLYEYCDGPRCKIINKIVTDDYLMPPPVHCALENLQYKINLLEGCKSN
ncbi:radical SAM/SPASM domain-containing protein [Paeniclostridium hominis]|uniref:radical SAM/SPASM domain-containing protein n=1 Tax=Paeniclostridium hominis TaxID=2764329 RepID=UPI0022E3AF79|nr:radical SAM protein [Paeniclostridium hominis]